MHKAGNKKIKELTEPLLIFFGILIAWELFVIIFQMPEYLFPAPTAVAREIIENWSSFLFHTGITMFEAIIGFLIANIVGLIVAISFVYSKTIERGLKPYAIALKTTPTLAMAPVLVLWFGTGIESKIVASALVCFFPILINAVRGMETIDEKALDLFKSLSAGKVQTFLKLRLPNALPYLFSALKISTSLAIVGAIVGEFVGANAGIGYVILVSTFHIETAKMFAAIVMSAIGGILFFFLISLMEKRFIFWYEEKRER